MVGKSTQQKRKAQSIRNAHYSEYERSYARRIDVDLRQPPAALSGGRLPSVRPKPCPFCGSRNVKTDADLLAVICGTCGIAFTNPREKTITDVVKDWNIRA